MKIEKLTENKIRVIVKPSDLDIKNLDIRSFMTKALKEQNFFTNMYCSREYCGRRRADKKSKRRSWL